MTLEELNRLSRTEAALALSRCCGSAQWARIMSLKRPYQDLDELLHAADSVWARVGEDDRKEAFACHPRIGDARGGEESTRSWAKGEQAGAAGASPQILKDLASANQEYEKKHGYLFIVCATGKTAEEMLAILRQRLLHSAADEIRVAAEEQRKITALRLKKLIDDTQP